jgi:hypothetical protein
LILERCAELGLEEATARKLYAQLKSDLATDRRN